MKREINFLTYFYSHSWDTSVVMNEFKDLSTNRYNPNKEYILVDSYFDPYTTRITYKIFELV